MQQAPRSADSAVATAVTTWYLQMLSRDALRPARPPLGEVAVRRAEIPLPALSRFLYTAVGGEWYWRDRLPWSHARWMQWLDRPEVQTWILYERGTPGGYIELEKQAADDVEIVYFGLMRQFLGRGLGGHLLSVGLEQAWAMGAGRVWVHTCTLDGSAALANYRARGLEVYKQETRIVPDVGEPDGPWPGWKG